MRRRVIAIGIDAAEGRLVRRLADEGRLPAIAKLAAEHGWGTVTSPASIGSGAVWPTFSTGDPPDVHGLFGEYMWDPEALTLRQREFAHLVPFWRDLADAGATVAVFDVPFAPLVGHERIAEIAGWGAHDWWGSRSVSPPEIKGALAGVLRDHPLATGPVDSEGPGDISGLRDVVQSCGRGARLRGDLALRLLDVASPDLLLVVFPELHRASHLLWHTVDAHHPVWREGLGPLPGDVMRGLVDIFQVVDEQIGRLVSHGRGAAATLVFSLHGMQPTRGIPAFLSDVLEAWGVSVRRPWWRRSLRRHAGDLIRASKQRLPASLKTAYYRRVSKGMTRRLSQPAVPVHEWDWARTRAFSIPSDQHGWVRINLAGREAQGSVAESAYEATCIDLRNRLLTLASAEGPLVRDVAFTASATGQPPRRLPDLIVHWTPLTWRPRLRLVDPPLEATAIGLKLVSQHDDNGFFVAGGAEPWPLIVDAAALGARIRGMLLEP